MLIAIWVIGFFSDITLVDSLSLPLYVLPPALAVLVVGLLGVLRVGGEKAHNWLTIGSVILMNVASAVAVIGTGGLESPFLLMWVITAFFSAISGWKSLIPVIGIVIFFGLTMVLARDMDPSNWLVYGLAFILPILFSHLTWSPFGDETTNDEGDTVSLLAKELSHESDKANIIINAIADGLIVIDEKGIIQIINPAAQNIVGWDKTDSLKLNYRSVLKIIDQKDNIVDESNDPVQRCLKTKEPVITEQYGLRTISGKKILASILASPLTSGGAGSIIVFRDITASRAEEREQAEFISTASHEMRTPVAAIEGYIGLALNPQTAVIDDKAREYLYKARDSAQHLGRLFQNLLDISKIEDGRLISNQVLIDVHKVTRSIVNDFASRAKERGIAINFLPDTTSGQPVVPVFFANVDRDHYREVVGNLVENAIKYTREGEVKVDIKGTNEQVYISIEDSGLGIPAEDIPHLFQKFYRVDNSDTREIGGTGLGLYLSRRLTESMDGTLTVESTYGKGSTFTIELPRVSPTDVTTQMQKVNEKEVTVDQPKA